MIKRLLFLLIILGGLVYWNQQPSYKSFYIKGRTMGTSYNISVVANSEISPRQLQKQINIRLKSINSQVSTWIKSSEISNFNALTTTKPIKISPFFIEMVSLAKNIYHKSQGALDITISPLIDAWGFDVNGRVIKNPTDKEIISLLKSTGIKKLSINLTKSTITKTDGNLTINLSAIAKGGGVDQVANLLDTQDIKSYLIEIGGEIRLKGKKIDGSSWVVGVESPDSSSKLISQKLHLQDISLATSGDYRNYFEKDEVRYSHIINPKTGKPITHKLASVSVLANSTAVADAWATALFVLGQDKGLDIANKNNLAVMFLVRNGDSFKAIKTPEWDKITNLKKP